jgi:hypothetical protein
MMYCESLSETLVAGMPLIQEVRISFQDQFYLMKARSTPSRSAASCAKEFKVVFASPRTRDSGIGLRESATGSAGNVGKFGDCDRLHGERPREADVAEGRRSS